MVIYYKSYRIIGGKPKLVVTDDNDNIVHDQNNEYIKLAIYDNRKTIITRKRKCCKCGNDKTYIGTKGTPVWRLHHKCDNKKNCTGYICYYCDLISTYRTQIYLNNKREIKMRGRKCCECKSSVSRSWFNHLCNKEYCSKYLCVRCYGRHYQKNDPNSQTNIIKYMRDWRIGQLSRYSTTGKGLIGVYIVCKFLGTEDNNIRYDNFNFYIDTNHSRYGYVEVKISSMNLIERKWNFGNIQRHRFDTSFLLCMDEYKPWRNVRRIYIIPYQEIIGIGNIGIYMDPDSSRGPFRYDSYIVDERQFNLIYQSLDFKHDPILSKIFRKDEIEKDEIDIREI